MNETGQEPPGQSTDMPPHRLVYSGPPPKTRHHGFLYVVVSIAGLIILVSAYIVLRSDGGTKSSAASTSSSSSQPSDATLPNPTQNPINDQGSINSQIKYCSNDVNAALVC